MDNYRGARHIGNTALLHPTQRKKVNRSKGLFPHLGVIGTINDRDPDSSKFGTCTVSFGATAAL